MKIIFSAVAESIGFFEVLYCIYCTCRQPVTTRMPVPTQSTQPSPPPLSDQKAKRRRYPDKPLQFIIIDRLVYTHSLPIRAMIYTQVKNTEQNRTRYIQYLFIRYFPVGKKE